MKKIVFNKKICYLLLLLPLVINAFANYSSNEDIWYIMRYGKLILKHGFMHTDLLSMHSSFHIVIQQSFSNIIFYLIYNTLNSYGFFLLCELYVAFYVFIIYKICMLLSNKNTFLSIILAVITCLLMQTNYITPRPQLFTYLHILLVIYIIESFRKDNKTKLIYILPLISLLQINLHASMWYILFLFLIPYVIELVVKRNKNVLKIIIIMIIMFLIGFINPYTYENVFFPFLVYNNQINKYISELCSVNLSSDILYVLFSSILFYILLTIQILIFIYYKKGKLSLSHLLLFGGLAVMSLINVRSIAFFIIGSIPFLAEYLKDINAELSDDYIDCKKYIFLIIVAIITVSLINKNRLVSDINDGGNYLKKHYKNDIIVYTDFDYGSYLEYLGFHPYFDTRAEVFTKKANKKEDIFTEAMEVQEGKYNIDIFINKYKFTHFVVSNDSYMYVYLNNRSTKRIYEGSDYTIFEK